MKFYRCIRKIYRCIYKIGQSYRSISVKYSIHIAIPYLPGSSRLFCVLTAVKASLRIHRSQDGAQQPQKNAALSEIPLHLE